MALALTMKVGNAICYVYDDELPKTEEESTERRKAIETVCSEIHWAQEKRKKQFQSEETS